MLPLAAVALSIGVGFAGVTAAQTSNGTGTGVVQKFEQMMGHGQRPGVFGKVTAISGTTLTVSATNPKNNSTTTYTVDASNAKVLKGATSSAPVASTLSAVAVGDTVAIKGTVSGTNVTASEIMDGVGPKMGPGGFGGRGPGKGRGVAGTVTAITGKTITSTNQDGTSYTIDASNAQVEKLSTIPLSQVAVGDKIGVEGTVSGTNVTAQHIMDGMPQKPDQD